MRKLTFLASALALMLAFGEAQLAQAQGSADGTTYVDENGDGIDDNVRIHHRRGHRGVLGPAGSQLSDEQKTELKTLVDGLKASDATEADVRAAIEAKFTEWGIELPEPPAASARFGDLLTEEQAAELDALVAGLRESSASRDDIHAAVDAQLETWGIEMPMPAFSNHFGNMLSEEQATELDALVAGLRASDATPDDIRAAVDAQLETWGVALPAKPNKAMGSRGPGRRGHGRR